MPLDKKQECIYECNIGIKCMCTDCNYCLHKPDNVFNELVKGNASLSNPYDDTNLIRIGGKYGKS